jgi:peptide deformylase
MSDILTIDTGFGIPATPKEEDILPYKLVDPSHLALHEPIPEYDETSLPNYHMSHLIKRLKMTMKLYGGIGISANQCGIRERVFIIGNEHFQMACINPRIVETGKEVAKLKEGCLSFPGLTLNIARHTSIKVVYYTESGEQKLIDFDGITAQCFQHELDHMNGSLFTEHVGPLALKMAKKKQDKLIKQYTRMTK